MVLTVSKKELLKKEARLKRACEKKRAAKFARTTRILLWAVTLAAASAQHWTITSNELIWRSRYTNCDKGYAVALPDGVVAHGSLPPSPNHGILVSAAVPGTTAEVTLSDSRIIDVYDTYDAEEVGSARAYLERYQEQSAKVVETRKRW